MLRKMMFGAIAAAFVVTLSVSTSASTNPRKTSILTFNTPIALPGVSLGPGTYIFELADPWSNPRIVRVTTRTGDARLIAVTVPIQRPAGMAPDRHIAFGEVTEGQAPRITAWYPVGENTGREFIY